MYTTFLADPPWSYNDKLSAMKDGVQRSSDSQYRTMSVLDICALCDKTNDTIAGFKRAHDGFLWLWVTNPFLLSGAGVAVCEAWGFKPKQLITWVKGRIVDSTFKLNIGLGHYTRGCTEHLILATRGAVTYLVRDNATPNVFFEGDVLLESRTRHSRKPESAYKLIERVTPGPYLELFARHQRPGWTTWGDECD